MIVTNKQMIKSYRANNNKDGFCIGDKVKYANEEGYWYVIGINRLYIMLGNLDGNRLTTITESFPGINLEMIRKCEKYPDLVIDRFESMFNKNEVISLITWFETIMKDKNNCEKMNFFEAIEKLREGYKVRNVNWKEGYYIFVDKDKLITDSLGLAYEMYLEDYGDLVYFIERNKGSWEIFE